MENTCTGHYAFGILTYANVDISKRLRDAKPYDGNKVYHYQDKCGITINITREGGQNGYKMYTHKVKADYIGGMYYKGVPQDPPGNVSNSSYITAIIHYWKHDDENAVPLLIGLRINGKGYDYYEQKEPFSGPKEWSITTLTNGRNKVFEKLRSISGTLKSVVVLKIDLPNGKYGTSGELSTRINSGVTIHVTALTASHSSYKKYEHRPSGVSKMRVLSTRNAAGYMPFEDPALAKEYSSASIYYWNVSEAHKDPLILELNSGTSSTFYKMNGKKWEVEEAKGGIEKALDEQNCMVNKAHILDIAQSAQYTCQSCMSRNADQKQNIMVRNETGNNDDYDVFRHYLDESTPISVSSFVRLPLNYQKGLPTLKNVSSILVYKYPQNGEPLLVAIMNGHNGDRREHNGNSGHSIETHSGPSIQWYSCNTGENEWKAMANPPTNISKELKRLAGYSSDSNFMQESGTRSVPRPAKNPQNTPRSTGDIQDARKGRQKDHQDVPEQTEKPQDIQKIRPEELALPIIAAIISLLATGFECYNYIYHPERSCIVRLSRRMGRL